MNCKSVTLRNTQINAGVLDSMLSLSSCAFAEWPRCALCKDVFVALPTYI